MKTTSLITIVRRLAKIKDSRYPISDLEDFIAQLKDEIKRYLKQIKEKVD